MAENCVRELRRKAGLTQSGLAERAGVRRSVITRIDTNPRATVPLDVAVKVAHVLSVTPEELLAV